MPVSVSSVPRLLRVGLGAGVLAAALGGCAPLVLGGAAVGGAVAVDRRSVGVQIEDEAIEGRVNRAIIGKFGRDEVNVNVTAYNRNVLLAGQVVNEAAKAEVEALARVQQNVATVYNELEVGPLASLGTRTSDTGLSARVRTELLRSDGVPAGTIRVTTEKSVVYLMGRVTTAEGDAAARVVSRVPGVARVVKLFEPA